MKNQKTLLKKYGKIRYFVLVPEQDAGFFAVTSRKVVKLLIQVILQYSFFYLLILFIQNNPRTAL